MNKETEELLAELLLAKPGSAEHKKFLSEVKKDALAYQEYLTFLEQDTVLGNLMDIEPSKKLELKIIRSYSAYLKRRQNNKILIYYSSIALGVLVAILVFASLKDSSSSFGNMSPQQEWMSNLLTKVPYIHYDFNHIPKIIDGNFTTLLFDIILTKELMMMVMVVGLFLIYSYISNSWRKSET